MFDPIAISTELGELPTVHLQTVLRFDSAKERRRIGGDVHDAYHSSKPVAYDPEGLWLVDHLVHTVPREMCVERAPHDTDERYAKRLAELKYTRVTFDWQVAQAAIDSVVGTTSSDPSSSSWVYVDRDLEAPPGPHRT